MGKRSRSSTRTGDRESPAVREPSSKNTSPGDRIGPRSGAREATDGSRATRQSRSAPRDRGQVDDRLSDPALTSRKARGDGGSPVRPGSGTSTGTTPNAPQQRRLPPDANAPNMGDVGGPEAVVEPAKTQDYSEVSVVVPLEVDSGDEEATGPAKPSTRRKRDKKDKKKRHRQLEAQTSGSDMSVEIPLEVDSEAEEGSAKEKKHKKAKKHKNKKRREAGTPEDREEMAEDPSEPSAAPAAGQHRAPRGRPDASYYKDAIAFLRGRLTGLKSGARAEPELRQTLLKTQTQIEEMIGDVVENGHSSSILILGDRGAGKTAVLERALGSSVGHWSGDNGQRLGVVRLNGLVTCDDRAVFKDLASQLCRVSNCTFSATASYEENLSFLKEQLESIGDHQAIVFVLDELDAFARRTKQTVLYNLFDALQSTSVAACVVGLSTRHDAVELLEKRVQSRFSNRKILVMQPQPPALTEEEAGDPTAAAAAARGSASVAEQDPLPYELLQTMLRLPDPQDDTEGEFNSAVEASVSSPEVMEALSASVAAGASPAWLADVALLALSGLDRTQGLMQPLLLTEAITARTLMESGQAGLVTHLSVLQLYLLVGLCRVEGKDLPQRNFEAVFGEYSTLLRQNSEACERFAKPVALRAFEELANSGMVVVAGELSDAGGASLAYQPAGLLLSPGEVLLGLKAHKSCPAILMEWLTKEAVSRATHVDV